MKHRLRALAALVWLFVAGFAPAYVHAASDGRKCYPIATQQLSYRVVFPNAKQTVMRGTRASIYLDAYNTFGNKTDFKGTVLLVNVLPDGTALVVPLENGTGCKRVVVGPRLHKIIMAKVARSAA